jgi:hypothetical protein
MKDNEVHFAFAMTPVEAEMLWRELNFLINTGCIDEANVEAMKKFRDRVLDFTHRHPCRYGADAL